MTKEQVSAMNLEIHTINDTIAAAAGGGGARSSMTTRGCRGAIEFVEPCKEQVQLMVNCCQDIASRLNTLQTNLLSEKTETQRSDQNESKLLLLQREIFAYKSQINELFENEIRLREKLFEMEETIQTLSAQLLIYKDDFDLERRDRERAQSRISQLEELLNCRVGYHEKPNEEIRCVATWSRSVRPSHVSHGHQNHNQTHQNHNHNQNHRHNNSSYGSSLELVARGYDVCDLTEADGGFTEADVTKTSLPLMKEDTTREERRPSLEEDGRSWREVSGQSGWREEMDEANHSRGIDSLEELKARSFNIDDFLVVDEVAKVNGTTTQTTFPTTAHTTHTTSPATTLRMALALKTVDSKQNCRNDSARDTCGQGVRSSPFCTDSSLEHGRSEPRTFFTRIPDDVETSQLPSVSQQLHSTLRCPKCGKSYYQRDHFLLLNHLEEC